MNKVAIALILSIAVFACASTSKDSNDVYATRIKIAFMELGAPEGRAACFANRLTADGNDDASREAAEIAEGANSREEMKGAVMKASKPTRRAFIGANMRCMIGVSG